MTYFHIALHPGILSINNYTIQKQPNTAQLLHVIGIPDRSKTIYSEGKPWRNMLIFDESGMTIFENIPEQTIAFIRFILIADGEPCSPKNSLRGRVTVNGVDLRPGMMNKDLPLKGEINFVKGVGNSWKFRHDHCFVSLEMKRLKTHNGRSTGMPVLFDLTYSFLS